MNHVKLLSAVLLLSSAMCTACASPVPRTTERTSSAREGRVTERLSFGTGLMTGQMMLLRVQRLDLDDSKRNHVENLIRAANEDNEAVLSLATERENELVGLLTSDSLDMAAVRAKLGGIAAMREQIALRWTEAYALAWNSLDTGHRELLRQKASEPILPERMIERRVRPIRGMGSPMGDGPSRW
jgi:Spy/CpxP family protein refolding chaperone